MKTECPICDADVLFNDTTEQGELIACDDCGSELEVTNLSPAAVEEAPGEEEDWGQ